MNTHTHTHMYILRHIFTTLSFAVLEEPLHTFSNAQTFSTKMTRRRNLYAEPTQYLANMQHQSAESARKKQVLLN